MELINIYGYIYITTNIITGKQYIGKHKSNVFDNNYKGSGKHLRNSMKLYGKEYFYVEMLEACESEIELNLAEKYWIARKNAQKSDRYYNISEGGDWGNIIDGMSEEELLAYKEKLSASIKKSYIKNPDLKKIRSATNYKRIQAVKNSGLSIEDYLAKKKKEEEIRNSKIRVKNMWKNNKHPWIGRKHSEESKQKISEKSKIQCIGKGNPNSKIIEIIYDDGRIEIFETIADACKSKMLTYKQVAKYSNSGKKINGMLINKYKKKDYFIESATTIENVDNTEVE